MDLGSFQQYWGYLLPFICANVGVSLFALAALFMLFHRLITRGRVSEFEIIYRWTALFAVGGVCLHAFILNAFYPNMVSVEMGIPESPFQYQIAIANLTFGILAIMSFNASYGFRLATVIGCTFWLWSSVAQHIMQMVKINTFDITMTGSWFWVNIVLPFLLVACLKKLKPGALIVQ